MTWHETLQETLSTRDQLREEFNAMTKCKTPDEWEELRQLRERVRKAETAVYVATIVAKYR